MHKDYIRYMSVDNVTFLTYVFANVQEIYI